MTKKNLGRFAAIAVAALMFAPAASAVFSYPADLAGEPSTKHDTDGFMHQAANAAAVDKIYFNAYMNTWLASSHPPLGEGDRFQPMQLWHYRAYLGFWRDCNNDGFVGSARLGAETYVAASEAVDAAICPDGSAYNHNGVVAEFLWIGPDANGNNSNQEQTEQVKVPVRSPVGTRDGGRDVNDTEARVWGDPGLVTDAPGTSSILFPLPKGSLSSWKGHFEFFPKSVANFVPEAVDEHGAAAGISWQTFVNLGAAIDGTGVPSPLAVVKNLFNESSDQHGGHYNCGGANQPACEGAYAQPIVMLWDCSNEDQSKSVFVEGVPNPQKEGQAETLYVAPKPALQVNPDGSVDGTREQNTRARVVTFDEANGGKCNRDGRDVTYNNLEYVDDGSGTDTYKIVHEYQFSFSDTNRVYELTDAERQPSEEDPRPFVPIPYTGLLDGHRFGRFAGSLTELYQNGWSGWYIWFSIPTTPDEAQYTPGQFRNADVKTFYAYVSDQAFETQETGFALSSAVAFPGGVYQYGNEVCAPAGGFGPGIVSANGWDCDPAHWTDNNPQWGVKVGQEYQLRDIDCFDGTLFGVTTPRPLDGWDDCVTDGHV